MARQFLARARLLQGRVEEAAGRFSRIVAFFAGTEWAALSLEQAALILEQREDDAGAAAVRRRLRHGYPDSPATARVWLAIAASRFRTSCSTRSIEPGPTRPFACS